MKKFSPIYISLLIVALTLFIGCKDNNKEITKSVIIIGIDGLTTDGFQTANTPNIDSLVKLGTLSLNTRGVLPTTNAPNWGAILTGTGPEENGITRDGWDKNDYKIEPINKDNDGYFPGIFNIIKSQKPDATTAAFFDWDGFNKIFNPKDVDSLYFAKDHFEVYDNVIPYIINEKPEFVFTSVDIVDQSGHDYSYKSEEYYNAITLVDSLIGNLISELKKANLFKNTNILLVSDHGGLKNGHGGVSKDELEVPWLICGPNIIANQMINTYNKNMNTSPSIALLMGIDPHESWIGEPTYEAFKEFGDNTETEYIPKPRCLLEAGIYKEAKTVELISNNNFEIRYTLNGDSPNEKSELYVNPFKLNKSAMIKAVCIDKNNISIEEIVEFIRIPNVKNLTLIPEPDKRYSGISKLQLLDGKRGHSSFTHKQWMGYKNINMEVIIEFEKDIQINNISIGCLHKPKSHILPPTSIEYQISNDGKIYSPIGDLNNGEINNQTTENINLFNEEFDGQIAKYLKIDIINKYSTITDTASDRENLWLFIDEIIIE